LDIFEIYHTLFLIRKSNFPSMTEHNEIASIQIPAGKRTYFFDVKQSRENTKYLKISENKRLENGEKGTR